MGIVKSFLRIEKEQIESLIGVSDSDEIKVILNNVLEHFDIDKTWEIIHYMITGHKAYFGNHEFSILFNPPNYTFEISEEEYDFYWEEAGNQSKEAIKKWNEIDSKKSAIIGYLNRENIRRLISILNQNQIDELILRTNFSKLNEKEIYPEVWEDSKEDKEYVKFHYQRLSEFLNRTLKNQQYLIVN